MIWEATGCLTVVEFETIYGEEFYTVPADETPWDAFIDWQTGHPCDLGPMDDEPH
ncbi:MAG: hypothetical protein AAGA54_19450 [Myxococcota bacterium]